MSSSALSRLDAEQKVAHHVMDHVDEGCARRLERGKTLERRIAFAAEPEDLAVEQFLGREMPEQQRLGDAGRLGELPRGGSGKALAGEQRHCRRDNRFAALVAVQSGDGHARRK